MSSVVFSTRVTVSGNSLSVTIPSSVVKQGKLKRGSYVEVILSPQAKKKEG